MPVDFSMFSDIFTLTRVAGLTWLVPIVLTFAVVLIVSRQPSKWPSIVPLAMIQMIVLGVAFGGVFKLFAMIAVALALMSEMRKTIIPALIGSKVKLKDGKTYRQPSLWKKWKYRQMLKYKQQTKLDELKDTLTEWKNARLDRRADRIMRDMEDET